MRWKDIINKIVGEMAMVIWCQKKEYYFILGMFTTISWWLRVVMVGKDISLLFEQLFSVTLSDSGSVGLPFLPKLKLINSKHTLVVPHKVISNMCCCERERLFNFVVFNNRKGRSKQTCWNDFDVPLKLSSFCDDEHHRPWSTWKHFLSLFLSLSLSNSNTSLWIDN